MIPVTLSLRSAAVVWCLFLSSVDWGLWTLTLCLIIHCCAVVRSSEPWLLHSPGQTDHEGSGWPAQSCLKHWQQLSHSIPSRPIRLFLPQVCLEIKVVVFSHNLDSGDYAIFDGCWVCKCVDRRDLKSWLGYVWSSKVAWFVKTAWCCVQYI